MSKELVSRNAAASRSLPRFFTGKPCRWGHISERYVKGGGCIQCMGGGVERKPMGEFIETRRNNRRDLERQLQEEKLAFRMQVEADKKAAKAEKSISKQAGVARRSLIKFKTLCPHISAGKLRAAAHMFAVMRDPRLRYEDVACANLTSRSTGHGVGLYTIACFPDDQPALLEIAKSLMKPMQVSHAEVEANRQAILTSAIAAANAGDDSWPEGDPR